MAITTRLGQAARIGVLYERLAELQGQRNVIDAQIVDVEDGVVALPRPLLGGGRSPDGRVPPVRGWTAGGDAVAGPGGGDRREGGRRLRRARRRAGRVRHRVPAADALTEAERLYLTCDSLVETWFEKDGTPIGVGRETREIPRRIRRALERRQSTCAVPGCGATRGLHAHHIWHWEKGGPTELWNLVLVCPFHHRLHHRKLITISGPGHAVTVTDVAGRTLDGSSVARPPTGPPPEAPTDVGPTGERAQWKWYEPFAPRRVRSDN